MITQIIEHLYLGDEQDAENWGKRVICVLEKRPATLPDTAIVIPILKLVANEAMRGMQLQTLPDGNVKVDMGILNEVADLINVFISRGEDVLVSCGAGIERSPLTVVWYLHKYRGMSIEEAYKFVQEKRPQVQERIKWLGGEAI